MSQLGLWLLTGTVPEKLRNRVTTGDGRREGLPLAVTQLVSGLVRELVNVENKVLVRNSQLHPGGTCSKADLSHCARTSCMQQLGQQNGESRGIIYSYSGHLMD